MILYAVDLALICIVGELAFILMRTRMRRTDIVLQTIATLGAGFFLLAAFRLAISNYNAGLALCALSLAGLCHLMDFRRIVGQIPPSRP